MQVTVCVRPLMYMNKDMCVQIMSICMSVCVRMLNFAKL